MITRESDVLFAECCAGQFGLYDAVVCLDRSRANRAVQKQCFPNVVDLIVRF